MRATFSIVLLLLAADGEPLAAPCAGSGVSIEVHSGSRLVATSGDRLELQRGQRLPCESPRARPVVAAIELALQRFPLQPLSKPVRVHLDPRVPRGHAPVLHVEVHVTSREILVSETGRAALEPAAWRHELFHTLAAPAPFTSPIARRLWLTLEEALVAHLTLTSDPTPQKTDAFSRLRPWSGAAEADFEQLAMPSYDPHPLAELLIHELARTQPPLQAGAALRCLMALPRRAEGGPETLRESARQFASRCPLGAERALRSAITRWLPEPLSPWPHPSTANAAALAAETR